MGKRAGGRLYLDDWTGAQGLDSRPFFTNFESVEVRLRSDLIRLPTIGSRTHNF